MNDRFAGLPAEVYDTAVVRDFDRRAIESGIAGYELMRRAGRYAFESMKSAWPDARSIVVCCGAGNNAGDGYVVADLALAAQMNARIVSLVEPARLTGDARTAFEAAQAVGLSIETLGAGDAANLSGADLIVDGLLGTGLARDVAGSYKSLIDAINATAVPVFALDIPSGLDSDTGHVRGAAIRATRTCTFGGLKQGLFLGEAPDYVGVLDFTDLGIPADIVAGRQPVMTRILPSDRNAILGPRRRTAHKGMNGRLLLVGGAADMGGAIRIAAEAALRAGVGLVYVATHPDSVAAVVAGRPEVICRGVQAPGDMADWLDVADAIAVGPGLGQGSSARLLLDAVLNARQPVVVDADGLNLIAGLGLRRDNWIVTPHPAEAGRLLGTSAQQVQADRLGAVQELAKELNAIAVLKGACSLIGQLTDTEDFSISVCDYGNPGMASPGMGDLLTGIIGALIAQGSPLPAAARIGVLVHALAGDTAAGSAERGLLASDLLPEIRRLVNP